MSDVLNSLKDGDVIYGVESPVSKSGTRKISFYTRKNGEHHLLNNEIADILGCELEEFIVRVWGGYVVGSVVSNLSKKLGVKLISKMIYNPEFKEN